MCLFLWQYHAVLITMALYYGFLLGSGHVVVHNIFLQSFVFLGISCYFSPFIPDFIYLGPLSFFLINLVKGLSILFVFSENLYLDSLIFLNFFTLYFIYICSDLFHTLPSTQFRLCLLFFFKFL